MCSSICNNALQQQKKAKQKKQLLNTIAIQQNCKITQHELCANFIIGLDENKKCVFFFK